MQEIKGFFWGFFFKYFQPISADKFLVMQLINQIAVI